MTQGAFALQGARAGIRVTAGPADVGRAWTLEPGRVAGTAASPAKLDSPGLYNLTITIAGPNETRVVNGSYRIYPDLGAQIVPENLNLDAYVNTTSTLTFLTVDPVGTPFDAFSDLTLRLDNWDDGHRRILHTAQKPLAKSGVGRWTTTYDFPNFGMHHMLFASTSGNFTFGETPVLHTTAVRAVDFGDDGKGTPALGALGVAVLAIALAGVRRR